MKQLKTWLQALSMTLIAASLMVLLLLSVATSCNPARKALAPTPGLRSMPALLLDSSAQTIASSSGKPAKLPVKPSKLARIEKRKAVQLAKQQTRQVRLQGKAVAVQEKQQTQRKRAEVKAETVQKRTELRGIKTQASAATAQKKAELRGKKVELRGIRAESGTGLAAILKQAGNALGVVALLAILALIWKIFL